jgi:Ubiquitin family
MMHSTTCLDVEPRTIISEVKDKMADILTIFPEDLRCFYDNKQVLDYFSLAYYNIPDGATVYMHRRLGGPPIYADWAPFLRGPTKPACMETDVALTPDICINFQPVRHKSINVYLVKYFCEHQLMENHWDEDWDASGIFWTNQVFPHRLMVLELRSEFAAKSESGDMMAYINSVKYDWKGINKSYYGGDVRSWQRYTTKFPIEGNITCEKPQQLRFTVEQPLNPNTWYAVVLLHNNHMCDDYIFEDMLIPFKTTTKPSPPTTATTKPSKPSLECCVHMDTSAGVKHAM